MKNTLFTLAVTALFCVACGSDEVQDAGSASVHKERLEALNAKFPIKDDLGRGGCAVCRLSGNKVRVGSYFTET